MEDHFHPISESQYPWDTLWQLLGVDSTCLVAVPSVPGSAPSWPYRAAASAAAIGCNVLLFPPLNVVPSAAVGKPSASDYDAAAPTSQPSSAPQNTVIALLPAIPPESMTERHFLRGCNSLLAGLNQQFKKVHALLIHTTLPEEPHIVHSALEYRSKQLGLLPLFSVPPAAATAAASESPLRYLLFDGAKWLCSHSSGFEEPHSTLRSVELPSSAPPSTSSSSTASPPTASTTPSFASLFTENRLLLVQEAGSRSTGTLHHIGPFHCEEVLFHDALSLWRSVRNPLRRCDDACHGPVCNGAATGKASPPLFRLLHHPRCAAHAALSLVSYAMCRGSSEADATAAASDGNGGESKGNEGDTGDGDDECCIAFGLGNEDSEIGLSSLFPDVGVGGLAYCFHLEGQGNGQTLTGSCDSKSSDDSRSSGVEATEGRNGPPPSRYILMQLTAKKGKTPGCVDVLLRVISNFVVQCWVLRSSGAAELVPYLRHAGPLLGGSIAVGTLCFASPNASPTGSPRSPGTMSGGNTPVLSPGAASADVRTRLLVKDAIKENEPLQFPVGFEVVGDTVRFVPLKGSRIRRTWVSDRIARPHVFFFVSDCHEPFAPCAYPL